MVSSRTFAFTLAVLASMAFGAATASAGQRYAAPAPTGSGTACTSLAPCDFPTAVESATAGDEVIVNPGTYSLGAFGVVTQPNMNIHGIAGGPKPVILSSVPTTVISASGGTDLSDLVISQTSPGSTGQAINLSGSGAVGERLEVTSTGNHACSVSSGAVLRDSTCINNSTTPGKSAVYFGVGAGSDSATVRNVTAIATGPASHGVEVAANTGATATLDLRNVIADGNIEADVLATAGAGGSTTVSLTYSNYHSTNTSGTASITPVGSPTNQTAPVGQDPIFVNAAGGDYHQATGSPTINAGAVDGFTGPADINGEARTQGTSIDIGADEFTEAPPPPPPDTTPPETLINKGPKAKTKSKSATFTFSADETASFQCKLDKGAFAPCTSPKIYKRLKKGKHTFSAQATDAAANADATAATYKWTVKKKPKKKHHH